jgi:signal transduction histidine kinase
MTRRLTQQYEDRVESTIDVIRDDLGRQSDAVAASLSAIVSAAADDNRLRSALTDGGEADRRYLLDYAGTAMRLSGLDMLQIQDERGRILSSGHFRNEYDRLEAELPRLLDATPGGTALVEVRAPDGPFVVLARVDKIRLGGRRYPVVAGVRAGERFMERLERDSDITVRVVLPDSADTTDEHAIHRDVTIPFIGLARGGIQTATLRVSHDRSGLIALRAGIIRWFVVVLAVTVVIALLLVVWLSLRLSRPLAELAEKTARVDLDRLDVDFDTGRGDEVGALSRLLAAMTERLRASAGRIRDAERRAAVGELARQVNHDIKNGLTPIRNVLRHLFQLSSDDPASVGAVLRERQGTLESSVSYLEQLSSNYARLSPRVVRESCDVSDLARRVVGDHQGVEGVVVSARLARGAFVHADPVGVRRILENLVDNAVDSIEDPTGAVTVVTEVDGEIVRVTVADTGAGMSDEEVARVFDDFYTTKEGGTGLGLSIVRRLVMDLDGSVRVESNDGDGSRFIVEIPRERAKG